MPKGDRATKPVQLRLSEHIVWDGACMRTNYTHDRDGYAWMIVGSRKDGTRRLESVHRVSYTAYHGPIPEGYEIDHTCKTRDCWNPNHLRALTSDAHKRLKRV